MSTEATVGSVIQILDLVMELTNAAGAIGFSLQEVAALQHQAHSEGRELDVEDFRKLHDGAKAKLDALAAALAVAEDEPAPIVKANSPAAEIVHADPAEEVVSRPKPTLIEEDPAISKEDLQVILGIG